MIDPGLNGKVVLITGANNPYGIGAATAKAFAAQGARVFLHFFRQPDRPTETEDRASGPGWAFFRLQQTRTADEVLRTISQSGGQAAAWEADLSDPENIPRLFDQAESAFGPVDILVNNAADWEGDTFLPSDTDRMGRSIHTISAWSHDRNFAVNSRAVALMMAEYARRFLQRGATWGRIINVSTDGASAFPGEVSYGASKHAMESYSRAAAIELGPYGITVNVVAPGPVQTGYITPEMEEKLRSEIPLRRVGQPKDVADVIVFLASEKARWVTGQLLYVGGGHVMPL